MNQEEIIKEFGHITLAQLFHVAQMQLENDREASAVVMRLLHKGRLTSLREMIQANVSQLKSLRQTDHIALVVRINEDLDRLGVSQADGTIAGRMREVSREVERLRSEESECNALREIHEEAHEILERFHGNNGLLIDDIKKALDTRERASDLVKIAALEDELANVKSALKNDEKLLAEIRKVTKDATGFDDRALTGVTRLRTLYKNRCKEIDELNNENSSMQLSLNTIRHEVAIIQPAQGSAVGAVRALIVKHHHLRTQNIVLEQQNEALTGRLASTAEVVNREYIAPLEQERKDQETTLLTQITRATGYHYPSLDRGISDLVKRHRDIKDDCSYWRDSLGEALRKQYRSLDAAFADAYQAIKAGRKTEEAEGEVIKKLTRATGKSYVTLIGAIDDIIALCNSYRDQWNGLSASLSKEILQSFESNIIRTISEATCKDYATAYNAVSDICERYKSAREAERVDGEVIKKLARATGQQGTLSQLVDILLKDRGASDQWGRALLSQQVRHKIGNELGAHFDDCVIAVEALIKSHRALKDQVNLHHKVNAIDRRKILKTLDSDKLEACSLSLLIEELAKSHQQWKSVAEKRQGLYSKVAGELARIREAVNG